LLAWLERRGGTIEDYAFPSRVDHADHLSARQYARLVDEWVTAIGLRREDYGNTVRYLGVDIEDALELAEHLGFDIVRPRSERGRASVQRPRLRNSTELLCAPFRPFSLLKNLRKAAGGVMQAEYPAWGWRVNKLRLCGVELLTGVLDRLPVFSDP
jgi:hypothetical protein